MFCCAEPFFAGCITPCSPLTFPTPAAQTGVYRLEYELNGGLVVVEQFLETGQNLSFPNRFNESGLIIVRVRQPNGQLYAYSPPAHPELSYTCFALRLQTATIIP